LSNEKIQLGAAFARLTTRLALIKLNEAYVDARPTAARDMAHAQIVKATGLLAAAQYKSERREAVAETFETLDLIDALLSAEAAPFLT